MLKVLIKKQLLEVFRSYFYDTKKNKARSKAGRRMSFYWVFLLFRSRCGGAILSDPQISEDSFIKWWG